MNLELDRLLKKSRPIAERINRLSEMHIKCPCSVCDRIFRFLSPRVAADYGLSVSLRELEQYESHNTSPLTAKESTDDA